MSVAALVLAAGRGERLGRELPKAFVSLAGRPILLHALDALAAAPEVDVVIPVVARADLERVRALERELALIPKLAPAVEGGVERQDSVRAGLEALPRGTSWVAVHDAARPLLRPAAVSRVIEAARREGAAILAIPVRDTIKRVRDGRILETPARSECWAAQTPQVFRASLLREALAKAAAEGFTGTDDAQIVERLGVRVAVVAGDSDNLKLTHPEDLAVAEGRLALRARGLRDPDERDRTEREGRDA
jgi:2-C-methyl-D-erythritol 4-phosphate cytidylyltransferase